MMSFREGRLASMPLAPAAVWLIGEIMEARGRQELYARQAPGLRIGRRKTSAATARRWR